MKKKKILMCLGFTALMTLGAAAVILSTQADMIETSGKDASSYKVVLDSSNATSSLTSSYQLNVAQKVTINSSYSITINYLEAKAATDKLVQLGNYGKVLNFSTSQDDYYGRISEINSIKVVFTGSLNMKTSETYSNIEYGSFYDLTTNESVNLIKGQNYFCITAGEEGAIIDSITIEYGCAYAETISGKNFGDLYTGVGNDGYTYKLERVDETNGIFRISSLDKETNISMLGELKVNAKLPVATLDLYVSDPEQIIATYTFNVALDYSKLTFVSVQGLQAALFPQISFDKVYQVENFERFTGYGVGYDQSHKPEERKGARSAFYCDYYSGSSGSPVGGSGWSLMGSTDYIGFTGAGGHNGSKAAVFKGNGNGLRFISYNLYPGSPYVIGKGSTLSFWAHGPLNGSYQSAGTSATIKVYAFFEPKITPSTQQTARTSSADITIPAGSDWTRYTLELDPNKNYYGFGFYFKQSNTNYTPIDDVEIFTANPYAKYTPVAEKHETLTVGGNLQVQDAMTQTLGSTVHMWVALGANGKASTAIMGQAITVDEYHIDNEKNVTLTCTFSYGSGTLTITKIEGKISEGSLTKVKLTGTNVDLAIKNNGNITLTPPELSDNCDASTAMMQLAYKRWYMSGSWTADPGNTDRITQDTTNKIEGLSSMSIRGYTQFSLTYAEDFPYAVPVKNMGMWIRNNTGKSLKFRIYVYKSAGLANNQQLIEKTIASSSDWIYVNAPCGSSIYNVRLYFEISGGVAADRIQVDNISIF